MKKNISGEPLCLSFATTRFKSGPIGKGNRTISNFQKINSFSKKFGLGSRVLGVTLPSL